MFLLSPAFCCTLSSSREARVAPHHAVTSSCRSLRGPFSRRPRHVRRRLRHAEKWPVQECRHLTVVDEVAEAAALPTGHVGLLHWNRNAAHRQVLMSRDFARSTDRDLQWPPPYLAACALWKWMEYKSIFPWLGGWRKYWVELRGTWRSLLGKWLAINSTCSIPVKSPKYANHRCAVCCPTCPM